MKLILGLERFQQKNKPKIDEKAEASSRSDENHHVEGNDSRRIKRKEMLQPKPQPDVHSTTDVISKNRIIDSSEELARRLQAEEDSKR